MSGDATYHSDDPLAACIGAERENSYELHIMIDVDCETTYTIPKEDIPEEFHKYGLPVWLTSDEDGKIHFEKREIKVTSELLKEQEEIDNLVESFKE